MSAEQESEAKRKFWFAVSVLFVIAGVAFYWTWGLWFDTWNLFSTTGLGAYVITILLISFGLIGLLLTRKKSAAQQ